MKGFYFSLGLLVVLTTASSTVQAQMRLRGSTLLADGSVRIVELRTVEGIERLGPELNAPRPLSAQVEVLEGREVELDRVGSGQDIAAGVAVDVLPG